MGAEVPRGEGQGLQDSAAGCGGGEEGEAGDHGGGIWGGTGCHFCDENNGRGGLLLQPVPKTNEHDIFTETCVGSPSRMRCYLEFVVVLGFKFL